MKRALIFLSMLVVSAATVPFAYAQSATLSTDVPFEFVVGKATLPAGRYEIADLSPGVLRVRGEDSGREVAIVGHVGASRDRVGGPRLEFRRVGNRYFLKRVWDATSTARELPKSPAEREAERGNRTFTTTLIAARAR